MSIERSLQLYKGLVKVSGLLVEVTDARELLSAILEVARKVLNAEAAALFLADEQGNLRLALYAGGDGEPPQTLGEVVVPRGQGISGWALEHRQCVLVPDVSADPRFYHEGARRAGLAVRSLIGAPLWRGERRIGVLEVFNPLERQAFEPEDREAFEAFANLAATAIDKARAAERRREEERIRQELSVAHEIQRSFLPGSLPTNDTLACAAHYRAAHNVSGDFYDVAEVGPDEIYFVIGDVSGRGVPAALLMAQSLSLLRLIVRPGLSPAETLRRWNNALAGRMMQGFFITATVGRIRPSRREVELATAGHCSPILLRGGTLEEVPLQGVPPLGLMDSYPPQDNALVLCPGDFLLFYTDGLTESASPDGRLLGREGVFHALGQPFTNTRDLLYAVTRGEETHRGGNEPEDDLTLLLFGFR